LPDVPTGYFDPLTFSTRSFSAAPSGRQLDLRLSVFRTLKGVGDVQLQAVSIKDENNIAGAPMNYGLIGSWRTRF